MTIIHVYFLIGPINCTLYESGKGVRPPPPSLALMKMVRFAMVDRHRYKISRVLERAKHVTKKKKCPSSSSPPPLHHLLLLSHLFLVESTIHELG